MNMRILACVAGLSLLASSLSGRPTSAQEKIVLTTPLVQAAAGSDFRLWQLNLRRSHPDAPAQIVAVFAEVKGTAFIPGGGSIMTSRVLTCRYDGAEADALIIALNKANLSTISLERRVTQRCQMDIKVPAGALSGSPE